MSELAEIVCDFIGVQMSQESRKSPRKAAQFDIVLIYPSGEQHHAVTRDVSEGGLFVIMSNKLRPILGELVSLRLIGESTNKMQLPSTEAVVVHTASQGIGLAYIFIELDDEP